MAGVFQQGGQSRHAAFGDRASALLMTEDGWIAEWLVSGENVENLPLTGIKTFACDTSLHPLNRSEKLLGRGPCF